MDKGGHALVGRDDELAVLRARLSAAANGDPTAVVITGEAGMGKTALARAVLAEPQVLPLVALCDAAESALAFGVVDQLLRSAAAVSSEHVPDRIPASVRDPLSAGAVLLDALGAVQTSATTVLLIDDLQWADAPSAQAVLFLLRRLRTDRVLCVLTARTGTAVPEGLSQLQRSGWATEVALGPLSVGAAALLAERAVGGLPRSAVERLVAHTGGNPLYVAAVLRAASRDDLLAARFGPLPAPEAFAADVRQRFAALSPGSRALVAAGAVLGQRFSVELAARVAKLADPELDAIEAPESALGARLLEVVDDQGAFRHPLVHAAVYHSLSDADRRRLHRVAAGEVSNPSVALRHEAAAARGPDAELAARLRAHAMAIQALGPARARDAAEAWLDAARLEVDRSRGESAHLQAASALLAGGLVGDAAALLDAAAGFAQTPLYRVVEGEHAYAAGQLDQAVAALGFAWEQLDPREDAALAARVANLLAAIHLRGHRPDDAALWAQRAIDAGSQTSITSGPRSVLVLARVTGGDIPGAEAATADLPDDPALVEPARIGELVGRALLRIWTEDLQAARTDLVGLLARIPGASVLSLRIIGETYLSLTDYHLGDWDSSLQHADAASSAADDGDQLVLQAPAHAVAGVVLAARGALLDAEAHVEAALSASARVPDASGTMFAHYAAAVLDDQRGRLEAVAGHVDRTIELTGGVVIGPIDLVPWRLVGASALGRLGRLEDAAALVQPYAEAATRLGLPRAQVRCLRVDAELRALAGDHSGARSLLEQAMARPAADPFDRARVRLALGELLQASSQRQAALDHLAAARRGFHTLRAGPWAERVGRLMAECAPAATESGAGDRDPNHPLTALTPQERAIALLVARGLRNREVAAELVISAKTVEYHLSHVFQKLHLTNRAQLAALMAVQN